MPAATAAFRLILAACLLFFGTGATYAELARIGMVHFTGNVESAGYLGGSLSSAIDDSLKKKFSYQRISEEKIKTALEELSKIGIFDPRKIPEKNNLLRIAVALKADILIYGSYGIIEKPPLPGGKSSQGAVADGAGTPGQNPAQSDVTQISMRTYVYYVNENRTAELPELKPNLDASLFEAINTSAENVVAEFKKITVETESDEEETGSIQTAATLRMAWLPIVAEDKKHKAAVALYKKTAESVRDEKYGIQISDKSVAAYAQSVQWQAATQAQFTQSTQFLADAATALKTDIVFWPQVVGEGKKKYLVVSAYHAQLGRILFAQREELKGDDATAEKLQKALVNQLRGLEFTVTAQIAGLKGAGLVLEFGGSQFEVNAGESTKNFGKVFKTGEQFHLIVKKNPKEPRQVCHVRNAAGSVTFKNIEILITCITETVPLLVKTVDFHGGELLVSLDGREEMKIAGLGEQVFQTRVEDLQVFDIAILSLPKLPAQSCRVSGPSKLADGKAIDVQVRCHKSLEHQLSGYVGYPAMGILGSSTGTIQVNENFPVGKMSSFFAVSVAYQVKNLLPYNLLLGAQVNFSTASATLAVQQFSGETSTDTVKTNMIRTDLIAFTAYPVPLPYRLELLPYAGFGLSYQSLWRSGGASLSSGISPMVSLGAIVQYDYTPSLKFLFKTGPDLYFYSGGQNLMIWSFNFGVGKQFI